MRKYKLITIWLLVLSLALVLLFAMIDLYYLTIRDLDVVYLYMLAGPAAVLSCITAQFAVAIGFVKGWRECVGGLGGWLLTGWTVSIGFLFYRFFFY